MMMMLHVCGGDVEEMADNYFCCENVQDMRYHFSG